MKNNKKRKIKHTDAWYRAEIKRLDKFIDKIRAKRFGIRSHKWT